MRTGRMLLAVVVLVGTAFSSGGAYDFAARAKPSDRWYQLNVEGQRTGFVHVSRRMSEDELAPILFEHELVSREQGRRVSITLRTHCEDNDYYYPLRLRADIKQSGYDPATVTALVEKKIPYGNSKSKMAVIYRTGAKEYHLDRDLPEHTVADIVLMDIIPRLPFKTGRVFQFNLLILEKVKVRKGHKIEYQGVEEIEIEGRKRKLHKFEQKGKGIKQIHYWVDDNHQLIRILKDKREELLLSTETQAKAGLN